MSCYINHLRLSNKTKQKHHLTVLICVCDKNIHVYNHRQWSCLIGVEKDSFPRQEIIRW